MNKLLPVCLLLIAAAGLKAQVKIGSAGTANTNAVLELDGGTSKGLLLPKLTAAQITAMSTAPDGLVIYNTTDGFLYLRKNAAWQKISDATNGGGFTLPYAGTASTVGGAEFAITHSTTFGDVVYFTNTAGGSAITTAAGNNKLNMTSGNTSIGIPPGLSENPTLGRLVVRGSVGATVAVFDDKNTGVSLQSNLPGIGLNEYYNAGSKYINSGFAGKLSLSTGTGDLGWYVSNVTGTADVAAVLNQRWSLSRGGSMTLSGPDGGYIFKDRTAVNYAGWNWYADAGKASLYRYTVGGNTISIDSTGALGLQGVVNPTAPLTMASATGNKIDFYYSNPTSRYGIGVQGALLQLYSGTVNDDIAFGYGSSTSFTERMRVKGNGNVGIGVVNPSGKLDITQSGSSNALNVITTGSGFSLYAQNNNAAATAFAYNTGAGPSLITLGRVGINNVDPSFSLDVQGRMRLRNEAANVTSGFWLDGPTLATRSFIGTFDNNTIGFYGTTGWGLLFNHTTGQLNIGATRNANDASYKLNVGGKILSEEVRVQLQSSWPDYVFDKQYQLRSIAEFEQYIELHQHLPGIQPAAEIKKDGFELGVMNKQLLEKVEELSLYIIQLNKRIEQLENK